MENRVVVTGMGIVTPIGISIEKFWPNLIKGVNGVGKIKSFNTEGHRTEIGGEVKDFDENLDPGKNYLSMGRASRFAILSIIEALKNASIDESFIKNNNIAVSVGTTMGEMQILEKGVFDYVKNSYSSMPKNLPAKYPCNIIANNIAGFFGTKGQVIVIPSACAAGNFAIGYGYDLIKSGRVDCVIAGGTDPISEIALAGFNRLMACSPDICAPFDAGRKGMIVSEGAGFLILENLNSAKKRNVKILAEIPGYGVSNDAFKSTIPHPEGKGGILAVKRALKNSNIKPEEVDYICAHGTGTGENDRVETIISKEVFGDTAYKIPISSLKSMLGHTMGACSAIQTIAVIKMMHEGIIAPTINYKTPDPLCDLDYVPNIARKCEVKIALNNAYAFGGNNSALVIKKYEA